MIETIQYNGATIKIEQDQSPMNPRTDWDNLGTMVCFHKRYSLGDESHGFNSSDYDSWGELAKAIEKNDVAAILPLYLYDHSGITMSTGEFSCRWDSGQVGFIFITKKKAREEFGIKRITKEWRDKLEGYLKSEVETYDQYLTGDVYSFEVEFEDGETDSCGGFFGSNHEESGLLENAKSSIDCHVEQQ